MLKSNALMARTSLARSKKVNFRLVFRDWHLNLTLGILAFITYVRNHFD